MQDLMDYRAVDFSRLLILKAKSLKIDDESCHILLIMLSMQAIGVKVLTPQKIAKYSTLNVKRIDEIMIQLIQSHILDRHNGQLDFKPLYRLLLNVKGEQEVKEEINLISQFEDAFGRSLSATEVEFINEFKRSGFDDVMIMDALKEAVKSQVLNFRYVERILDNWSRYGVKVKQKEVSQNIDVSDEIKNYNWWD